MSLLIKYKANSNALDNNGNSPLMSLAHSATYNTVSRHECLDLLLNENININHQNKNGDNALMLFLNSSTQEEIKEFLSYTKKLINKGIDLTQKNNQHFDAFYLASHFENSELIILTFHDKIDWENVRLGWVFDKETLDLLDSLELKTKLDTTLTP